MAVGELQPTITVPEGKRPLDRQKDRPWLKAASELQREIADLLLAAGAAVD